MPSLLKPRRLSTNRSGWTGGGLFGFWRVLVALAVMLAPLSARADFSLYVANRGNNTVSTITSAGAVSTLASADNPLGLALDPQGNLYVADGNDGTVSKVTPAGVVSTFASGLNDPWGLVFDASGNLYVANYGGNDGNVSVVSPAGVVSTFASGFNNVVGLAFDASGNLYVMNGDGNVFKVTPAGVASTFASGFSGPAGLAIDGSGDLYVANANNDTVSVITPAGVVSTFASGFSNPYGLAFDGNGDLYVANEGNGTVSVITPGGVESTFASGLSQPTSLAIVAAVAAPAIITPPQNQTVFVTASATMSVAVSGAPGSNTFQWQRLPAGSSTWVNLTDGGSYSGSVTPTLIVADTSLIMSGDQFQCVVTNTVSSVTTSPVTLSVVAVVINTPPQNQTVLGGDATAFTVSATGAGLGYLWQVSTDGGMTWTPLANNAIYSGVTTTTLAVSNPTFAMSGFEYECVVTNALGFATSSSATLTVLLFPPQNETVLGGNATTFTVGASGAGLGYLWQVSTDGGTTWTALTNNATYSGVMTTTLTVGNPTVAISGYEYECVVTNTVGPATSDPATLTVLPFVVYLTDSGANTDVITSAGVVSTFASGFNYPQGLAFDGSGNLYVANLGNGTISVVTPAGVMSTFASGFDNPQGLAFDAKGNLYVANDGNNTVSMITPAGVVSTFASGFTYPVALAFDGNGNLYVANNGNSTISEVTPAGVVSTFASGFDSPQGLAFDGSGDLYVGNSGTGTVSEVTPAGVVSEFASGFSVPAGLAFDGNGNLYVAIADNGTVSVVTPAGVVNTFASGLSGASYLAIVSAPAAPAIITPPQNQTVAATASATLSVAVSGAPGSNTFQWQRLPVGSSTWVNLTDAGSYSGSATPTLTVADATFAMSGDQFQCVATNTVGSIITSPVTLTVVAVVINTPPQNQAVASSYPTGFTVVASGANLAYLWQVSTDGGMTWTALANNTTYSGVTTSTLMVSKTTSAISGYEYECVVTNSSGTATSDPATLTVEPFVAYLADFTTGTLFVVTPAGVLDPFASGFDEPASLAIDGGGNLYVANGNGTVSKVTPAGVVSTFASGFSYPSGLAFDASGNLYVANSGNDTISKVTPAGVVSTFASGFAGPQGIAFDGSGNLYVANFGTDTVSVITPAGVVSTFASGFDHPIDLAFDGSGDLYVSNLGDEDLPNGNEYEETTPTGTVSEVTPAGVVSTFASGFFYPHGLAFDGSGNLYVVIGGTVSAVTPAGVVSTFASDDLDSVYLAFLAIASAPAAPTITVPPQNQTVAASENGALFVGVSGAPGSNTFQWQRLPAGSSTWVNLTDAGSYSGSATPTLTVADATFAMSGDQFQCVVTNAVGPVTTNPITLTVAAVDISTPPPNQSVLGGDAASFNVGASGANLIYQWQVSTDGGMTWAPLADNTTYNGSATLTLTVSNTTLAMSGYEYECVITSDFGMATSSPATLTVLPFILYVATETFPTQNPTITQVTSTGVTSTFASGLTSLGNSLEGLAIDASGNLYVASSNGTISKVTAAGVVSTFASGLTNLGSSLEGLAFDASGNLYVATDQNDTISKVTPAGVVSTFASGFSYPSGVAFDASGNLYVADRGNGTISRVTPAGVVSTFASGFNIPEGLAFDGSGNLYVANDGNNTVSVVTPAGVVSTFASGLSVPRGLAFDGRGNLYVAEFIGTTIVKVTPAGVVSTFASVGYYSTYLAIVSAPAAPTIVIEPQSQQVVAGQIATFTAGGSGAPGANTFQWQVSTNGGTAWTALANNATYSGVTTSTLTVSNTILAMSGYKYECIVTNTIGSSTSNPATLTFLPFLMYAVRGVGVNGSSYIVSQITPAGVVSTFASGSNLAQGLAIDGNRNLYMENASNGTVSKITPAGVVSALADRFGLPRAFDRNGNLYVIISNFLSVITPAGVESPFASGFNNYPTALAFDGNGYLYVANQGNGTVSEITPAGQPRGVFASGFNQPAGLAFDGNGNLYVANSGNGTISRVTPARVVSTFSGGFNNPQDLAFDENDNLYVANQGNGTISKLTPAGALSIFASGLVGLTDLAIFSPPTIASQPQNADVAEGSSATFNVFADGAPPLSFQWQVSPDGGNTWGNVANSSVASAFLAGNNTSSSTLMLSAGNLPTALSGYLYKCIVANGASNVTSTTVTLTVNPPTSPPATPVASFAAWENLWFTSTQINNLAVSGSAGTPANDGIPNLVKYAFNLNPFTDGHVLLPMPQTASGMLTLTFQATQSDLTYSVEASTDLLSWSATGVNLQTNGTQITASYPLPASGAVFLRIVVTFN